MKIGLCGLGVMGKNHLRVIQNSGLDIQCSYDPQIKNFSYDDFLKTCEGLDGVIVASPTKTHTKIIFDILNINNKIKILCEKPISFSTNDEYLDKLIPYKKNILVGQIERFNPMVLKMQELIKNQKILQIKTFRVSNTTAREQIDARKDIGIHDVDVCLSLLNNKNVEDFKINSLGSPGSFFHEVITYKIDDSFIINEVSWKYPYKSRKIEILTDDKIYKGDYFSQEITLINSDGFEEKINFEKVDSLHNEFKHFCEMIENDCNPRINIIDNIELLRLLNY